MKIKNELTQKDLLQNKNYQKYFEQKERIRKKYHDKLLSVAIYPNQEKEWVKYKKQITDLLFKPKGYYQKFMWDMEQAQIDQENAYLERRVAKRKSKNKDLDEDTYEQQGECN
jgi:hypothetical protein